MSRADLLVLSGPAVGLLASAAFIVLYSRKPWRDSEVGKMLMLGAHAFALLAFSYTMARADELLAGDWWPFHGWARSVAWWMAAAVYMWKARIVCRAESQGGGRDRD